MRVTKELWKLGGLLTIHPISKETYGLDQLLSGIDAERKRLGKRTIRRCLESASV